MGDPAITERLRDWRDGDRGALAQVVPEMYGQLRRAAAGCLRREWSSHTLQSTALVHEAYAVLATGPPVPCRDRRHFLGIARRLMQQILIQYARRRGAAKRGGEKARVELEEECAVQTTRTSEEDALEEALARLRRFEPRRHLILEMHYRGGCSVQEVAAATGVSTQRWPAQAGGFWNRQTGHASQRGPDRHRQPLADSAIREPRTDPRAGDDTGI